MHDVQARWHRARTRWRSAPTGWPASPALGWHELAVAIFAGVGLALITTWPLVLHLGSRISPDLGDPVRTAWQVAWVGHAMLRDALHLFDSNAFYPHRLSLAFSDSLLGYGPAGFLGSGTVAALVRYNLIFLSTWALCYAGAYLLARELGLRRVGAAAAGVAFAYAPYRATEAGHFQVISSGGIALALFLLLRGYRRGSRSLVLAGWLVSAWQLSLGWTLGLQYSYLLVLLALLFAWQTWQPRRGAADASSQDPPPQAPSDGAGSPRVHHGRARAGPPLLTRRLLGVTCVGIAVVGAVAAYQANPYLKVSHEYTSAKRALGEVRKYSAGPAALLAAPADNHVWGSVTAPLRRDVGNADESVFFPGLAILALALIGLAGAGAPAYTRRLRLALGAGAVLCALLALGFGLGGAGYPYRLLYNYAPGWNGVRVPGRIFTLTTLCLALLAGAGAQSLVRWLQERAARRSPGGRRPAHSVLPAMGAGLLLAAIVVEGARNMPEHVVPQPARAEIGLPAPLLDLPTDAPSDRLWQYFSADGFYKIPVGNSTFDIAPLDDLRGGMSSFPDRASVAKLRWYGIRTVVLHTTMPRLPGLPSVGGPEPANPAVAALKPVAGLGITRRRAGSLVIYEIGRGPKALHLTS
jgi:hypothetical protein